MTEEPRWAMTDEDRGARTRRGVLAGLGALSAGSLTGLAGCLGGTGDGTGTDGSETATGDATATPVIEKPDGRVFYPTHVDGMRMVGTQTKGPYACALTYTFPHRFWLVTGQERNQVQIREEDTMHVMPIVWHRETGIVVPDTNPQLTVRKDGADVTSIAPWPMLSQPMGFHFGDNVALEGQGVYEVEVAVGEASNRRTGSLAEAADQSATFTFDLEYSRQKMNDIMYRDVPDEKEGSPGAVPPMEMDAVPSSQVPGEDELPGQVRGTKITGDADFTVTTLENAEPFGGGSDQTYLAVVPRTPYNDYMLPMMSLSATIERGGETVFDDYLISTIDPELSVHYGAAVDSLQAGDTLTVQVDAPPQTARHLGYETAFLEMADVTYEL